MMAKNDSIVFVCVKPPCRTYSSAEWLTVPWPENSSPVLVKLEPHLSSNTTCGQLASRSHCAASLRLRRQHGESELCRRVQRVRTRPSFSAAVHKPCFSLAADVAFVSFDNFGL